jgi:hypothetical protein
MQSSLVMSDAMDCGVYGVKRNANSKLLISLRSSSLQADPPQSISHLQCSRHNYMVTTLGRQGARQPRVHNSVRWMKPTVKTMFNGFRCQSIDLLGVISERARERASSGSRAVPLR